MEQEGAGLMAGSFLLTRKSNKSIKRRGITMFQTSVQQEQRIEMWSVLGAVVALAAFLIGGYLVLLR
jgi:hypothetical protein